MSTQEELVTKFKEAFEQKNLDALDPFLSENMTYETLPSPFVPVPAYHLSKI